MEWPLDANAAWTPADAFAALDALRAFLPRVAALEQPFPVDVVDSPGGDVDAWARAVAAWRDAGVLVVADESARDARDVVRLASMRLCHGVNLKVEKAGGARGVLCASRVASELGLRTWLGIMVSTGLGCSATAALLAATAAGGGDDAFSDLDGDLLATECSRARFEGGVEWVGDGLGLALSRGPGHGVVERRRPGAGRTSVV